VGWGDGLDYGPKVDPRVGSSILTNIKNTSGSIAQMFKGGGVIQPIYIIF